MISRLALIVIMVWSSCVAEDYTRTTAEIAAAEKYQAFLIDYRNRAERLFNSVLIETRLRVQKLESQNLSHRAEALQTFYGGDFERMQDTIDTFFKNFDEEFLIGAKKLDDEEASEKIKTAFVRTMERKIKRAFTTLLTFYSRKFELLEEAQEDVMKQGRDANKQLEGTYNSSLARP
ncbi:hypothetical protein H0W26_05545 [Candidatus Dependentiae bacterium]|nr:hypothetical protein [Candidatus Dependentiae bacterium]